MFSKINPSFFTIKKVCSKIIPSFFTIKEGSTSHLGLLPSGKKRETALRCSEPLRYKVVGPSEVCAILCGMGPPYYSSTINFLVIELITNSQMHLKCNQSTLIANQFFKFFEFLKPFHIAN